MRKITVLYLIILATMTYGQEAGRYTLSTVYENVEYSISIDRQSYSSNDSIVVNCLIKNLSDTSIFIYDPIYYEISQTIYNSEIYFDYGGEFLGSLNLINKLITLYPSDCVSIDLPIQIEKDSLYNNKRYLIEVGIGTYRYDKDLEYLTRPASKFVRVENNDMYKLSTLYNSISLCYFPIYIQNNSGN